MADIHDPDSGPTAPSLDGTGRDAGGTTHDRSHRVTPNDARNDKGATPPDAPLGPVPPGLGPWADAARTSAGRARRTPSAYEPQRSHAGRLRGSVQDGPQPDRPVAASGAEQEAGSAAPRAPSSGRTPPQGDTRLNGPYQSPSDLRSLVLTLRQRGRTGALTPDDVARYCGRILENAAEWERQQRAAACLPLLDRLGLAIVRPAGEGPKR